MFTEDVGHDTPHDGYAYSGRTVKLRDHTPGERWVILHDPQPDPREWADMINCLPPGKYELEPGESEWLPVLGMEINYLYQRQ